MKMLPAAPRLVRGPSQRALGNPWGLCDRARPPQALKTGLTLSHVLCTPILWYGVVSDSHWWLPDDFEDHTKGILDIQRLKGDR